METIDNEFSIHQNEPNHLSSLLYGIIFVILVLIIGNIVYLHIQIRSLTNAETNVDNTIQTDTNSCSSACQTLINEKLTLQATSGATVKPQKELVTKPSTEFQKREATESIIPFGSGTTAAKEWQDIQGATAIINTAYYRYRTRVLFEATIQNPNGNQTSWVRLYNVTQKHPVWFTELSVSGGIPSLLTSPAITLDEGNNSYQIQMKTQLGDTTNLLQARVRIISE